MRYRYTTVYVTSLGPHCQHGTTLCASLGSPAVNMERHSARPLAPPCQHGVTQCASLGSPPVNMGRHSSHPLAPTVNMGQHSARSLFLPLSTWDDTVQVPWPPCQHGTTQCAFLNSPPPCYYGALSCLGPRGGGGVTREHGFSNNAFTD